MRISGTLQISFQAGKALAAYLYLPHDGRLGVKRSLERPGNRVLDFAENG